MFDQKCPETEMQYYCGIDLHSYNPYMCVIDDNNKRLVERKLANDSQLLIAALSEYKNRLDAVAIESTFNWYWLSDALTDAGFKVLLICPMPVLID